MFCLLLECRQIAVTDTEKQNMKAFCDLKSQLGRLFIFVMFILSMQGCIVFGDKYDQIASSLTPDNSIVTGSVSSTSQIPNDTIMQSDEHVIRDQVKSLPETRSFPQELKWDNSSTGSEGTISSIVAEKKNGQFCRHFKVTRSAFDGNNLYHGEICQVAQDVWTMTAFDIEL